MTNPITTSINGAILAQAVRAVASPWQTITVPRASELQAAVSALPANSRNFITEVLGRHSFREGRHNPPVTVLYNNSNGQVAGVLIDQGRNGYRLHWAENGPSVTFSTNEQGETVLGANGATTGIILDGRRGIFIRRPPHSGMDIDVTGYAHPSHQLHIQVHGDEEAGPVRVFTGDNTDNINIGLRHPGSAASPTQFFMTSRQTAGARMELNPPTDFFNPGRIDLRFGRNNRLWMLSDDVTDKQPVPFNPQQPNAPTTQQVRHAVGSYLTAVVYSGGSEALGGIRRNTPQNSSTMQTVPMSIDGVPSAGTPEALAERLRDAARRVAAPQPGRGAPSR